MPSRSMKPCENPSNQEINVLNHKKLFAGWGLLCLSLGCTAATLGRAQGAVWIGSPLNITVQVQLAEGEELTPDCLEADVFHADTRQDSRALRLAVEPGSQSSLDRVVRIESPAPVDEPVVTVYLRAGCQHKNSRRYVLLADPPVQAPAATPSVPVQPVLTTPSVAPPARQHTSSAPAAPREPTPPKRHRETTATAKSAPVGNFKGKPRLKLDPLDLAEDGDLTLRSTSELTIFPDEDPQRRAEAVALWRALNAPPQDTLRDDAQVQNMQNDVSSIQTLNAKNQRNLTKLAQRLETAQAERDANWQLYALILAALLLMALVVVMVLLWRRRASARGPQPGTRTSSKPRR